MASYRNAKSNIKKGNIAGLERQLARFKNEKDIVDFVNSKNKDGQTLFFLALDALYKKCKRKGTEKACRNFMDTVLLLNKYADRNIPDRYNNTLACVLFHSFTEYLDEEWMLAFIGKMLNKEDMDAPSFRGNQTLLHQFAKLRMWDGLRLALDKEADICVQDGYNETPLSMIIHCEEAPVDVVKRLACAETVNIVNRLGNAPLHTAARYNYTAFIPILLQAGASVDLQNRIQFGYLPLDEYCYMNVLDLDPQIMLKLMPKQTTFPLARLVANLSALWMRNRRVDLTNVKKILELLLLHVEFPLWRSVEFNEAQRNPRLYCIFVDGKSIFHRIRFNLTHLRVMTHCFTSCGFEIVSVPDPIDVDVDDDRFVNIEKINKMWKGYKEVFDPCHSLASRCLKAIRSNLAPLTVEKIKELSLPSSLKARVSRAAIAQDLYENLAEVLILQNVGPSIILPPPPPPPLPIYDL